MKIVILFVAIIEIIIIKVFADRLADTQTIQSNFQNNEPNLNLSDVENQAPEPILLRSIDDKKEFPKETQMAQCTVQSTDGLKVQAQATFSKKLDGICSTDDMKMLRENLRAMESRLYRDIHDLQLLIRKLLPQNENFQNSFYQESSNYRYPPNNYEYSYPNQELSHRSISVDNNSPTETLTLPIVTSTTENLRKLPKLVESNKLKSLDTSKNRRNYINIPSTTTESTTAKIVPKNEYTYYWKLDNFPKVFQNAKKNEVFSHIFNVKGLSIRIRATLNLKEEETLLLDIEHLAENTEKLEVGMSDGLIFQEIVEEKLFQYGFIILDQNNPHNIHVSPTYWNNDNENYLIPNIHLLRNFLKDNSLLIKLIITF